MQGQNAAVGIVLFILVIVEQEKFHPAFDKGIIQNGKAGEDGKELGKFDPFVGFHQIAGLVAVFALPPRFQLEQAEAVGVTGLVDQPKKMFVLTHAALIASGLIDLGMNQIKFDLVDDIQTR